MENCSQEHQQIMAELAYIKGVLKEDAPRITKSERYVDLMNTIWGIFRVIGLGTVVTVTYKLFELLIK